MQEFVRNSCVFDKERRRQAGVGIVLWHFSFPSIFTVARCSDIFPCCPDSFRILLSSPRPPLPGLAGSSTTVVPAKPCHYSSPPREYISNSLYNYLSHRDERHQQKLAKTSFSRLDRTNAKSAWKQLSKLQNYWQFFGKISVRGNFTHMCYCIISRPWNGLGWS